MDVRLLNPFIEATLHVLKTVASTQVQAGKPYLRKEKTATGDVSGIIGLTGEAKGTISVSFSEGSILSIVSKMFGEEVKELNDEIMDAVGEISNMISGQARQKLETLGRSLTAASTTNLTSFSALSGLDPWAPKDGNSRQRPM